MNKLFGRKEDKNTIVQPITSFTGYYQFLNIDYSCPVYYQGFIYSSVTMAFQAARTNDMNIRRQISQAKDPAQFKSIVANIKNAPDWNQNRLNVMIKLNRDKFKRNKELGLKLFATQSRQLVNCYSRGGDAEAFWGKVLCNGKYQGLNTLGKLLVQIRQDMKDNTDSRKWLEEQNVESDRHLWPEAYVVVEKEGDEVDNLVLSGKNVFLFGGHSSNDFRLEHGSLSKFHAGVYFSSDMQVILVDLNSTNGTFVRRNNTDIKLQPMRPESLQNKDIIRFGMSSRRYTCYFSYEQVEKRMKEAEQQVKEELKRIQRLKQLEQQNKLDAESYEKQKQAIKSLLQLKQYSCLYVEGVTRAFPYQVLKQLFNKFGPVRNIRINIDQKTGRYMGSALIYYQNGVRINNVLENIAKQPLLPPEFRVKAVFHSEAEDIIATFSRKPAEPQEKPGSKEIDSKRKKEIYRSRSRDRHKGRHQNSSSSSRQKSSSSSVAKKRKHKRRHT